MVMRASVALFAASFFASIGFVIGNPNYSGSDFRIDVAYYANPASYFADEHPFTGRLSDRAGTHTPFLVPIDRPEAQGVVQAPSGFLITSAFFPMMVAGSVWLMLLVGTAYALSWAVDRIPKPVAFWRKGTTEQPAAISAASN